MKCSIHDFHFEPGNSGKEVEKRPQKSVSSESPTIVENDIDNSKSPYYTAIAE
jgi:hypothetical protein